MKQEDLFRTMGVLPSDEKSAPDRIRSRLTRGNIFGQWIAFLMFGVSPVLLGLFLLAVVPVLEIRLGLTLIFNIIGFSLGFLIARDVFEWVELDGGTLRWKHLFTRIERERDLRELESIETLTLAYRTVAVAIVEGLYGRVKGFEFRFRGLKTGIRVFRTDPTMTNVQPLVEAVIVRMYEHGDVEPEVIDFKGSPLVRRIRFRPSE
jgi:hypothetical protein